MTFIATALFAPGQMVRHKIHGYRGLIYDVDARFDQKTTWLEGLDLIVPTDNMPWYHILIAEENLEPAKNTDALEGFNHPLLTSFFKIPSDGSLCTRRELN